MSREDGERTGESDAPGPSRENEASSAGEQSASPSPSTEQAAPSSPTAGESASPSPSTEQSAATGPSAEKSTSVHERRADSFLEVEAELGGLPDGTTVWAVAVDVERVPATTVPSDFPVAIGTEEALALDLTPRGDDERTVRTYFEWPETGSDARLTRLLALHDVEMGEFADLYGREVLLRVADGHYLPVVPEQGVGDPRAIYGIFAGLVPSLAIALASFFGAGGAVASLEFFLLWLVCSLVVLPVSVYLDAWHLRATTEWNGGPLFWAVLAFLPPVNVVAVPYYLLVRQNARPLADRRQHGG